MNMNAIDSTCQLHIHEIYMIFDFRLQRWVDVPDYFK